MKRLLSGLLALALCFSSSFRFSWADTGDEWFCEEHGQWLIPEEDVLPGTHQVCLQCASANSISTFDLNDDGVRPLTITSAKYSSRGVSSSSDVPRINSDMTTLVGSDGLIYCATIPSMGDLGPYNYAFQFTFSGGSNSVTDELYLWYKSNDEYTHTYSLDSVVSFSDANQFFDYTDKNTGTAYTSKQISGRFSESGEFSSITLYLNFGSIKTQVFYFSDFNLTTYEYGGTPPPPPPGWDEEDGWLGSLIKSILQGIQKIIDGITNLPQNIANAVKGFFDMVVNAIVQLGQTILDGLKSLFIPSDGYFKGVATDMQSWLEDHLGLLVYPFTLVADLASRIAAVQGGEPTAHIPEIAYTDGDQKYILIEEQEVNLYDQVGRNETFIELHQLYLMAMDAAIGGALAFLAWKKFDQITGGSST